MGQMITNKKAYQEGIAALCADDQKNSSFRKK